MRERLTASASTPGRFHSPDDVEALVARMDASAEATHLRAAAETLTEAYREILLLAGGSSLSAAARAAGISPATFQYACLGPATADVLRRHGARDLSES